MTLSPADIGRLAASGDSANIPFQGRLIDPKDVAWQSAQTALYKIDSGKHFHFTLFDPKNPLDNQGFYYVTFKDVGAGKGDYLPDSNAMKANPGFGVIDSFVGAGNGSATLPLIALPQSTMTGEMLLKAASPWASAKLDVAGMDRNRNLFSQDSRTEDRGAAIDASALLGSKKLDRRSLWLEGLYAHATAAMTQEVSSAFDRDRLWDDTTTATRTGLRQSWQTSAGASFVPNSFAQANFGQFLHDGKLVTDRIGGSGQAAPGKGLLLDYSGNIFHHYDDSGVDIVRRDGGHFTYSGARGETGVEYREEWRSLVRGPHQGMEGAGVTIHSIPLAIKESVFYSQYRRGAGGLYSARDTGFSLLWDHELSRAFTPAWHADMSSHYFLQNIFNRSTSATILVTAHNEASSRSKGFSTRENYQVTVEQA
jgi:hypothetical protein